MSYGRVAVFSILGLAIVGSLGWVKHHKQALKDGSKNFQPIYLAPVGWLVEPHGPSTLFRYADPKTKLVLKGAVNQVVSDVNPTPELDTDGIAQFYIDRTKESMPNWTASKVGDYRVGPTDFEVIRRSTKDRVVVTAYAVKGNTTLLITLFGKGSVKSSVDPNMNSLYRFLDSVTLNERDMSGI